MGLFTRKKDKEEKKEVDKKSNVVKDAKVKKVKEEKKESKKSMKDLYEGNISEEKIKKEEKKVKIEKKDSNATDDKLAKNKKQFSAYKILIRPLVTEKINDYKEQGKYAFEVGIKTNKVEIAKAIEQVYSVKPASVNIINVIGKKVRRGRVTGKRKDWKKAIITIPKGKSIEVYKN